MAEKYMINRDSREKTLLIESAAERYQSFLQQHASLKDRLLEYDIASYLGINPATLSRIKRKQ
ncbi:MAG: hypothetical protein R3B45_15885 [Bdellovibrionota bacterium]